MKAALVLTLLAVPVGSAAQEPPEPPAASTDAPAAAVLRAAPATPIDRTPKRGMMPDPAARSVTADQTRLLGAGKAVDEPRGETTRRVEGVPPVSPQRLGRVRPEGVDEKKRRPLLGDIRAIDLRDGEALLRVEGVEQTIRPGMRLKTDVVRSVSPERLVLVRPEGVDEERGETLIIVDFLGAGRTRVRAYATRDWTAQPPQSTVE
jgi:hypothetical protein